MGRPPRACHGAIVAAGCAVPTVAGSCWAASIPASPSSSPSPGRSVPPWSVSGGRGRPTTAIPPRGSRSNPVPICPPDDRRDANRDNVLSHDSTAQPNTPASTASRTRRRRRFGRVTGCSMSRRSLGASRSPNRAVDSRSWPPISFSSSGRECEPSATSSAATTARSAGSEAAGCCRRSIREPPPIGRVVAATRWSAPCLNGPHANQLPNAAARTPPNTTSRGGSVDSCG